VKAVTYSHYGPPEVLELREIDRPVPGPHEVLVRVRAVEATKADCEMRGFTFPAKWFRLPLRLIFGIRRPRILVSGLNPHSGESGHLGTEERDIVEPALRAARRRGIAVEGPIPADTLFVPARLKRADCALALYHDQGLPVLKYASFGRGVNVTLGLPFVRTSVDHGTALDLAGKGRADAGSLLEALKLAARLARTA